jgi:O-antigen/teichoic acid export membrane protein
MDTAALNIHGAKSCAPPLAFQAKNPPKDAMPRENLQDDNQASSMPPRPLPTPAQSPDAAPPSSTVTAARTASHNDWRALAAKNKMVVNSLNLMLASCVTALFGFVFWILIARSFHVDAVGLAATTIAMSTLVSILGLAGFDTVFIRTLARSADPSKAINTGLAIGAMLTALIAAGFCLVIPLLAPKLQFLDRSPLYVCAFIAFSILTTWNTLTTAVLIAYRRTSYVLSINLVFCAVKLLLAVVIHAGGPIRIFDFVGIAQLANVTLSIVVLVKVYDYTPRFQLSVPLVRSTAKYASTIYAANILNLLPDFSLPLIVLGRLGSTQAAYFYVAFSIAASLYNVVFATTQSMLAEVSHEPDILLAAIRKALKTMTFLMVPLVAAILVAGPPLLDIFGESYRSGAGSLLRLLALSGVAMIEYGVVLFIFTVMGSLRSLLVTTAANAVSITVASLVITSRGSTSLNGIGYSWLIGTLFSVCVAMACLGRRRRVAFGLKSLERA